MAYCRDDRDFIMKGAYLPLRARAKAVIWLFLCAFLPGARAAEFEVLDKLSVDGYTVLRGSADIPGGSFTVGVSTLVVKNGNIGIGTTGPAQKLEVSGGNIYMPYAASKTNGYMLNLGNDLGYIWRNYAYSDDGLFISQNWYRSDAGDANVIPNPGHATAAIQLFRDGAIRFLTGGVNTAPSARMIINSSGNAGIGTAAPGARLEVYRTGGRQLMLDDREIKFRGDSVAHISIFGPDTGKSYLTFQNTSNNSGVGTTGPDLLTITSGGNVGIGTTGPAANLEIAASNSTTKALRVFNSANAGGSNLTATIHSDQPAVIGGAYPQYTGAVLKVTAFPQDTADNLGDILRVGTGGSGDDSFVPYLIVKARNGNVGVGTTAPAAKLEVAGEIKATNVQGKLNGLKMYAGANTFANGSCGTVADPCVVNISGGGFSAAPACTISIVASDASGYTENMVIKSITTTALNLWKGNYQNEGTTMVVQWICVGS